MTRPAPLPVPAPAVVRPRWLIRLVADSGYVFASFPLGIASFVVLFVGFAAGAGNAVTLLGLPVLSATMYMARIFARAERAMVARVVPVPSGRVRYKEPAGDAAWWRRIITPLTDGQSWLDRKALLDANK
jgi:hypothetical protein